MSSGVKLQEYDNSWYDPGRSVVWRALWLFLGQPIFRCFLLPSSRLRVALLRRFGAEIGKGVVIHSEVVVKYPWKLFVGDYCWIGERVWIDNVTTVHIGNNVCVSQGSYLCTGNHDWSDPTFGLRVEEVNLLDGAWAGAMCTLLPGSLLGEGAVAAAGSVVSGVIPPFEIFGGNPAVFLRKRHLKGPRSVYQITEQLSYRKEAR